MRPYREYRIWQLSHQLTLDVYNATANFPADERSSLTRQIRRAAYSVPFNIVEGSARGDKEFHQFLRISLASAAELDYGLLLSRDLGYLSHSRHADFEQRINNLKPMIVAFMAQLRRSLEQASTAAAASRTRKPTSPRPGQQHNEPPTANGQRPTANS